MPPQGHQAGFAAPDSSGSFDSTLNTLTPTRCQQLIALLNSQLKSNSPATPTLPLSGPSVSNIHGTLNHPLSSSSWVLDTSATCHVCCHFPTFISPVQIENSLVTLPNGHSVPI